MSYKHPQTSLNLCLSHNDTNLNLVLDPSSQSLPPPSFALNRDEPRVFSCNYCQRKFYSSQALGGHQNAHKLERTLAKKSRELSSVVRPHSGLNHRAEAEWAGLGSGTLSHGRVGRFFGNDVYGRRDQMSYGYEADSVQDEFNHLDLSLRL